MSSSHKICCLICMGILGFYPQPAQALVELGTDIFFSALSGATNEIHIRTRNFLYVGVENFSAGLVARVEPQHEYLTDVTYGLGARYGKMFFVEADAGILKRTFEGVVGNGSVFSLLFGWNISDNFRIVIPITAKRVEFTSDKRWIVDYVPFFGVRVGF